MNKEIDCLKHRAVYTALHGTNLELEALIDDAYTLGQKDRESEIYQNIMNMHYCVYDINDKPHISKADILSTITKDNNKEVCH